MAVTCYIAALWQTSAIGAQQCQQPALPTDRSSSTAAQTGTHERGCARSHARTHALMHLNTHPHPHQRAQHTAHSTQHTHTHTRARARRCPVDQLGVGVAACVGLPCIRLAAVRQIAAASPSGINLLDGRWTAIQRAVTLPSRGRVFGPPWQVPDRVDRQVGAEGPQGGRHVGVTRLYPSSPANRTPGYRGAIPLEPCAPLGYRVTREYPSGMP